MPILNRFLSALPHGAALPRLIINYSPAALGWQPPPTDARPSILIFHSRIRQSGLSRPRPAPIVRRYVTRAKWMDRQVIKGSDLDPSGPEINFLRAFVTKVEPEIDWQEGSIIVIRKLCWHKANITAKYRRFEREVHFLFNIDNNVPAYLDV